MEFEDYLALMLCAMAIWAIGAEVGIHSTFGVPVFVGLRWFLSARDRRRANVKPSPGEGGDGG